MQIKTEIEKTIILTLNEHEAKWLKELMQNPTNIKGPNDEEEIDKEMCSKFWDALCYAERNTEFDDI